jgi:hypothetical protein
MCDSGSTSATGTEKEAEIIKIEDLIENQNRNDSNI